MLDWLDAIPNLGVPGVPGVQAQKSAVFEGTPAVCDGVPGVPEHLAGTPGTPAGTPAFTGNLLIKNEEHPEHQEHPHLPEVSVRSILLTWQNGLNSLDPLRPLHGLERQRWHNLYDDAIWLAENFAVQAARDGWSTADLWGIWPDKPHYGGLADRLRGSRSLVMAGERACWRSWGRVEQFNRGAYPEGVAPRLKLLWQCY